MVTADVVTYMGNGDYGGIPGMIGIHQVSDSHYYLPPSSVVGNKTISVGSASEAYGRMSSDENACKQNVYNLSWARNDRLIVNANVDGTIVPYVFM